MGEILARCDVTRNLLAFSPELLHDAQSMVGVVQTLAAVCGDCDDVLDPNPEPAREIDSRLYREAHTWHQRLLFTLDHVRRLVSGYSDSVTGAMNELLAIACIRDDTPSRSVDLLTAHTGTYRVDTSLLGKTYDLVHLANLRSRLPDADRARGVRPVAVPQTSEVQDNRITRLDHPIAGLVVWVGPIGTGSDDCEVDLLVSELSQQISKISSDFGLKPAGEAPLHDLAVGRVGRCPGSCQTHQLVVVLDRTHHRKSSR